MIPLRESLLYLQAAWTDLIFRHINGIAELAISAPPLYLEHEESCNIEVKSLQLGAEDVEVIHSQNLHVLYNNCG